MEYKVTPLSHEHLDKLLDQVSLGIESTSLRQSYFSPGSISYCLLANGEPVFAGGIVNLMWNRGEAWVLPTRFFRSHVKICFKTLRDMISKAAKEGSFKRVQATCAVTVSAKLFEHLGFEHEGTMKCFGPRGEDCLMYARLFR